MPSSITENTAPPPQRKGERTRARLLEAAKEVFEEDGFLDARISDIAERAGVSHGTFYTYFESKDEIFREVALMVEDRLSAPLGDVILLQSSRATPHERIREAMRRHLESYRDEARIMGVIEQVTRHDDRLAEARLERHRRDGQLVADSIRQLQRHGLADPRLEPTTAAAVLGSMTNRFPEMWLTQGMLVCSFDEGVEQLTLIFTNALALSDPAPAGEGRSGEAPG